MGARKLPGRSAPWRAEEKVAMERELVVRNRELVASERENFALARDGAGTYGECEEAGNS